MAFRRYRKRGTTRPKGRRVYRKKTGYGKKTSRSFATKVKKIVHRMAENKTWTQTAANVSLPAPIIGSTSATSVQPWSLSLLPTLSQGTGSSNRIGNRVRMVKNRIRGFVNVKPYNSTTNTYQAPIMVKLFIFSSKTFNNFVGDMGFSNWQQFFKINNADTGFVGNPLDMLYEVNSELWTLHATRSFQLNTSLSGTITVSGAVYQSTSGKFSVPFSFDLIKYAKDLKYDDNSSTRVTNRSLLMTACCCYADGTTNGYVVPYDLAEIHYIQDIEYEDL